MVDIGYNLCRMNKETVTKSNMPHEEVIEAFLLDIYKVYKSSFLYASDHPSLLNMLVKPFKEILPVLDEAGEVAIRYKRGEGFFWADLPVARKYAVMKELGEELFKRRIQTIFFLKGLKIMEIRSFIEVLNADFKKVQDSGGCEKFLTGKGVSHIWFNEVDYSKILERQKEEQKEASQIEVSEDKEGTGHGEGIYDFMEGEESGAAPVPQPSPAKPLPPGAESQPSSHEPSQPQASAQREEEAPPQNIDELVKVWREAKSLPDFEKTGNLLMGRAFSAVMEKDIETALKVANAFLGVAGEERDEGFKMFVSAGLDRMVSEKGPLDMLLDAACGKTPAASTAVEALKRFGGRAAGKVADRLALEEDAYARHIIDNILVGIGRDAISQLLERLNDNRWYMVRNMVRILGEIGIDSGVEEALTPTLLHSDARVRKEVVRAVSMIRGAKAPTLLRRALIDRDEGVAGLAVVSLGLLRDEGSIQALIDQFDKMEGNEVKKEIIRALGRIGSRRSVSFLTKTLLEKKGWLSGKKDDELKIACAGALAEIGTPEAARALESGAGSSKGAASKACEDGLRRIRHG